MARVTQNELMRISVKRPDQDLRTRAVAPAATDQRSPPGRIPCWQLFDHGADVGVRGIAADLCGAYEQAAIALTAVITDPARVNAQVSIELECCAPDPALLLVDWLNALVYEMAVRDMLFASFAVRTDGRRLSATCGGEPLDRARHRPAVEVKGATQTALRVRQLCGLWIVQCVVDV